MDSEGKDLEIFKYGTHWLRTDFHLHTKADKEFKFTGEDNRFVSDYIEGLKNAGIRVGAITNHNKFDASEFKALRKNACKNAICLLPGVELSVNDGANGIHTLIIFSDQWLDNGNDYISPFISSMFPGKAESEYQHENGRSDKNILQVVEELEKTSRDYFLIFAHVEQRNGLWEGMKGGKLGDFTEKRYGSVRKRTLGFQKVRTRDDRGKVQKLLREWYPAEVEGSDCKSISDIGKGREYFLKLGAFSFEAVQFALIDHSNRTASGIKAHTHSRIRNIRFTGGTLAGQKLHFSPELNTLIGIRGSGKSSILEVLRYAVDIPFGEKAGDTKYKQDLVGFTMGSGGKIEIDAVDRYGQPYTIRRVWKEPYSEVLIDGILQPGVSIRETVLHKPIYFGQKDLSSTGEGFETDLVDKLLGSKLDQVRRNIAQQKQRVIESVDRLDTVSNVQDQIGEQKKIKQDTEHRLKFYAEHGVEEKLQKRLDFDLDVRTMQKGGQIAEGFVSDLESLLAQHEDDIRNFKGYQSKHNLEVFKRFYSHYNTYITFVDQIKAWLTGQGKSKQGLSDCRTELDQVRKGMVEEFAQIERKLGEELKSCGIQNISSEEFLGLKKKLAMANQLIIVLQKQGKQKKDLWNSLFVELHKLNELWLTEFNLIKTELDKVGSEGNSISISSGYKEEKQAFLDFMKSIFKGSGIRETIYQGIVDAYTDFIAILKDFENAKGFFESNPQILTDLFRKNLKSLLTFQTPNKFTIMYRGKELKHHSLCH
ncbi:AAA family ATPase [uncultured Desulfobacter sp.]|uniref:AAA family ATPase n=1 Tax=uncultured Desulfobacter sp. TaxID=240139 RepID=UPI002AA8D3CE|nr:AAA family ATPase [uncultured Desulfobacter sp.]